MAQQVTPATTTKPTDTINPQAANQTTANLRAGAPTDATLNANATATKAGFDGSSNIGVGGAYVADLVEDRMTGLLSKDNSYMQMNRAQAAQQANSRGLLNTSIAAGAGQAAAIQGALPIASQDSSAVNQFRYQQQQGDIQAAIQGSINSTNLSIAQMNNEASLQRLERSSELEMGINEQLHGLGLEELAVKHEQNRELQNNDNAAAFERLEYEVGEQNARAFADVVSRNELQYTEGRANLLNQGFGANHLASALESYDNSYANSNNLYADIFGFNLETFGLPNSPSGNQQPLTPDYSQYNLSGLGPSGAGV